MPYFEISFSPVKTEEDRSFLMAELLNAGFDSFDEQENCLRAYIAAEAFSGSILNDISFLQHHPEIIYDICTLDDINWNKEWESNYKAITIAGKCHVRAPFHPPARETNYEIIIDPEMTFGTAHHETTRLVATWLMDLDVRGKKVLDMGCGTGLLAILANKMRAEDVIGIDNDEWAYRNAKDNFRINNLPEGKVIIGDAALIHQNSFDLILANINRNALLNDMRAYYEGLRDGGLLLLSGFYEKDINAVAACALDFGLHLSGKRTLNDWAVILLYK